MKTFIFISIFSTILFSESMYNGKCVDNYYTLDSTTLKIQYSRGTTSTISESKSKIQELIQSDGYFKYNAETGFCESATNQFLGMNEMQFNFLNALTGLLSAFLITFIIAKRF